MILNTSLSKRIELAHQILANGLESSTPYYNDLLQSLNGQHQKVNQMARYWLNEIDTVCKQEGIEFSPNFHRIS